MQLTSKPFTDEKLTWNKETRRYTINQTYLFKRLEIDLGKEEEKVQMELDRVSEELYDYIYNQSCKYNNCGDKRNKLEYILAKDTNLREQIVGALMRFHKLDDNTDQGASNEYFGDVNIIPKVIHDFLVNTNLIRYQMLNYDIEYTENDFVGA